MSRDLFNAGRSLLLPFACLLAAGAAEENREPLKPALVRFGDHVTFLSSFDNGKDAELAAGEHKGTQEGEVLELTEGLFGRALECGRVRYSGKANIDFRRPGTLFVWICPLKWSAKKGDRYLFLVLAHAEKGMLLIGRQWSQKRSSIYSHVEYRSAGQEGKRQAQVHLANTNVWKNGEWHSIAFSWWPNRYEFSLDGCEPVPRTIGPLGKAVRLYVGVTRRPQSEFLIDEVTVFDRPLSADEIRWLHIETLKRRPVPTAESDPP